MDARPRLSHAPPPLIVGHKGESTIDSHVEQSSSSRSVLDRLHCKLSRETSSGRLIPEMDGLRFAAIGMVVFFHLNGYLAAQSVAMFEVSKTDWMRQIASVGFHGVELFFVISGFILALPFAAHFLEGQPRVNLKKYYLRRLTRLEPPYVFAALLLFLLAVAVQGKNFAALAPHLASSLLYMHGLIYGHMSPVIGVGWSLEIEVQFYVLVPLLTLVFAIRDRWLRRSILAALIMMALALQAVWPSGSPRYSLSILAFLQFFLVGFFLADIFLADWRRKPARAFYWDAVALVGWPLLFLTLRSSTWSHWFFPGLIFVLYCAAFRGRICSRLFSYRWITVIGGMCYSIYLIHYEVISAVGRFTRSIGAGRPYWAYFIAQIAFIGPAVLIICGAYFVLIERPCMRRDWPQRLGARIRKYHSSLRDRKAPDMIPNSAES